jgi:hypothetical protein
MGMTRTKMIITIGIVVGMPMTLLLVPLLIMLAAPAACITLGRSSHMSLWVPPG